MSLLPSAELSSKEQTAPLPLVGCEGCGACCLHIEAPPFREDERQQVLPELLAEIDAFKSRPGDRRQSDGPCLWFDVASRRCRHYEHRPHACRDFQVGEYLCVMVRDVAFGMGLLVADSD